MTANLTPASTTGKTTCAVRTPAPLPNGISASNQPTRTRPSTSSAAAAAASAAVTAAAMPGSHDLLQKATSYVKANRSGNLIRGLRTHHQRSDSLLAQALLLQQLGTSRTPCPTCGVGCSRHALVCRSCQRPSHVFCTSSPICLLCSLPNRTSGNALVHTFLATTTTFTHEQTFDTIEVFIEAAPSRRRIRALNTKARPSGHATIFLDLVKALLTLAFTNTAAELILFYLPRI